MFVLTKAGEKFIMSHDTDPGSDTAECVGCCVLTCTYGTVIGVSAAAGAIGQSILSQYYTLQLSYDAAVRSGALGGVFSMPANALCARVICGGNDAPSAEYKSGCDAAMYNWLASLTKQTCFVPRSLGYTITQTAYSTALSTGFFIAGAKILGVALTADAVAQAAAVAATGNVIMTGSIVTTRFLYKTCTTGKIDCCTPSVKFVGCDDAEEFDYTAECCAPVVCTPPPLRFSCCQRQKSEHELMVEAMLRAVNSAVGAPRPDNMTRNAPGSAPNANVQLTEADINRIATAVQQTVLQNTVTAVEVTATADQQQMPIAQPAAEQEYDSAANDDQSSDDESKQKLALA